MIARYSDAKGNLVQGWQDELIRELKQLVTDFEKMQNNISTGSIIQESDIHLLSPGDGYKWIDKKNVIGHFAKQDISANEIIYPDFIE